MIVNHRYRFIFIRTRKTAGSSVEIGLSRACGPGDIITPMTRAEGEEALRQAEGGYGPAVPPKPIRNYRSFREWRRLLKGKREPLFTEHASAHEVIAVYPDLWADYFTFAIERNSWDRAVSLYWWRRHKWERQGHTAPFPGISDFLRQTAEEEPEAISNWPLYAEDERILVDRVLRFEDLDNELARLASELDIRADISLPAKRLKSGHRKPTTLSDADAAFIAQVCAREIAAFGYQMSRI